jgi:hypothetical protein
MFYDFPMGTLVGTATVIAFGLIAYLILRGLYTAVDSWLLPLEENRGKVVGRHFEPAHTDTLIIDGVPHLIPYGDKWSVLVEVNGNQSFYGVSEEYYHKVTNNEPVLVEYVSGRLSGDMYIKNLCST